jgi:small subunit ribosomal protein S1
MDIRLPEGSTLEASVVKVLDKGVVVDLGDDVEGFVPLSQIPDEMLREKEGIQPGQRLDLRVVRVDPQNRRIVLSVKAFLQQEERDEMEGYVRRHSGSPKTTIGDLVDFSGGVGDEEEDEDR